jgi:acetoin utilization deacetylase AcuC-like enzyme
MASQTGYVYKDRYQDHVLYNGHPESPERLVEIQRVMKQTGLDQEVTPLEPLADPLPFIETIHTSAHIQSVKQIPVTGEVSELAVGGALAAVKAVSEGTVKTAFCAIRPPGHHAHNSGGEEGFCFYNNVAIAARYAQAGHGHKKILILDWDYHHGNGTENAFYDDPSVLFFSTHDWYAYPGTGDPSRTGTGAGAGYNINVHLACGATDDDIRAAWETKLLPAAEKFKPDFIFISAGFDSRVDDLLGCFLITDKGFAQLTDLALGLAHTHCGGRVVSLLEGGYNVTGLAQAVTAHVGKLVQGTGISAQKKTKEIRELDYSNGIITLPEIVSSYEAIAVHSLTGQELHACPVPKTKTSLDLKALDLSPGNYYLSFKKAGALRVVFQFGVVK